MQDPELDRLARELSETREALKEAEAQISHLTTIATHGAAARHAQVNEYRNKATVAERNLQELQEKYRRLSAAYHDLAAKNLDYHVAAHCIRELPQVDGRISHESVSAYLGKIRKNVKE